jgi:hypothetical protein
MEALMKDLNAKVMVATKRMDIIETSTRSLRFISITHCSLDDIGKFQRKRLLTIHSQCVIDRLVAERINHSHRQKWSPPTDQRSLLLPFFPFAHSPEGFSRASGSKLFVTVPKKRAKFYPNIITD